MATRNHPNRPHARWGKIALALLATTAAGGAGLFGFSSSLLGTREREIDVPRAVVRRVDLYSSLRTGGRVESSENTVIECELENLSIWNAGRTISAGGNHQILSIIPDGATVKKGDVLATIDASGYEELVRTQAIKLRDSQSLCRAAELELESQQIRLKEYRDGLLVQLKENCQARIALARAEYKRQVERLAWTKRMVEMSYLPAANLRVDQGTLDQTRIELQRSELAYSNLIQYGSVKAIASLEAAIVSATSGFSYRQLQVKLQQQQFDKFKKQLDRCVIRAPHDGFIIYANEDDDDTRIELGAQVRERQDLFYLPNLSKMRVSAMLHESVVRRVREGMPAFVRVEALHNTRLEAHVTTVATLPTSIRSWNASNEVKNFEGLIQLDTIPAGLLPGMTAEVEIVTAQRPNSLVIPPQALAVEDDRDYCYVTHKGAIERRAVRLGEATPEMIEVIDGLDEGDQVVLDPTATVTGELAALVTHKDELPVAAQSQATTDQVAQHSL